MDARSRIVTLDGVAFETPLLVPALSSKAVGPVETTTDGGQSILEPSSLVHSRFLLDGVDEALLISAYDIHYKTLASSEELFSGYESSKYAIPTILFIDSGWYELSVGPSSGPFYHEVGGAEPFTEDNYRDLASRLDPTIRGVLTSWDSEGPYEKQMELAQAFFETVGKLNKNIILKPVQTSQYHHFENLSVGAAGRLRAFDIVGVAEKDLGISVVSRLQQLWSLRRILDEADVSAPIHVFGGLDPLLSPLYFAAGGEIFDGLGWLRYAYRGGLAQNRESAVIANRVFSKRLPAAISKIQLDNLDEISELSREMKVFANTGGDWSKLRQGAQLEPAYDALLAKVRG